LKAEGVGSQVNRRGILSRSTAIGERPGKQIPRSLSPALPGSEWLGMTKL
jgi:hypothetical protein